MYVKEDLREEAFRPVVVLVMTKTMITKLMSGSAKLNSVLKQRPWGMGVLDEREDMTLAQFVASTHSLQRVLAIGDEQQKLADRCLIKREEVRRPEDHTRDDSLVKWIPKGSEAEPQQMFSLQTSFRFGARIAECINAVFPKFYKNLFGHPTLVDAVVPILYTMGTANWRPLHSAGAEGRKGGKGMAKAKGKVEDLKESQKSLDYLQKRATFSAAIFELVATIALQKMGDGTDGNTVGVIAFFEQERAALEFYIKEMYKRTMPDKFRSNPNLEDRVKCRSARTSKGSSYDTVIVIGHRRECAETWYRGDHHKDPAQLLGAMSRGKQTLYLVIEELSTENPAQQPLAGRKSRELGPNHWTLAMDYCRHRQRQPYNFTWGCSSFMSDMGLQRLGDMQTVKALNTEMESWCNQQKFVAGLLLCSVFDPSSHSRGQHLFQKLEQRMTHAAEAGWHANPEHLPGRLKQPPARSYEGMSGLAAPGEGNYNEQDYLDIIEKYRSYILHEAVHVTAWTCGKEGQQLQGIVSIPVMDSDRLPPDSQLPHLNTLPCALMIAARENRETRFAHHKAELIKIGSHRFWSKACRSKRPEMQVLSRPGESKRVAGLAYIGMGIPRQHEMIYGIVCRFSSEAMMMDILRMLRSRLPWTFNKDLLSTNDESISSKLVAAFLSTPASEP